MKEDMPIKRLNSGPMSEATDTVPCERNTLKSTSVIRRIKMVVILRENNRFCDAAKQILVSLWGPDVEEPPDSDV